MKFLDTDTDCIFAIDRNTDGSIATSLRYYRVCRNCLNLNVFLKKIPSVACATDQIVRVSIGIELCYGFVRADIRSHIGGFNSNNAIARENTDTVDLCTS